MAREPKPWPSGEGTNRKADRHRPTVDGRPRPEQPLTPEEREVYGRRLCACGCGQEIYKVDKWRREALFVKGHRVGTDPGKPKPGLQKITDEVIGRICDRLAAFPPMPFVHACGLEFVSSEAVTQAMQRNEEWQLLIAEAKARGALGLAQYQMRLTEDGSRSWASPQSMLERLYPKEWGLIQRKELSGPDGEPIATKAVTFYLPANPNFPQSLPAPPKVEVEVLPRPKDDEGGEE